MDPLITSSLISVGGSLLGGLFGRKKKKQTRVTPLQLRNEALQAGFNPLTVLGAASGGGFGNNPLPPLSSMEVVGNAIQDGAQILSRWDPHQEETRDLENQILRQNIAANDEEAFQRTLTSSFYGWGSPIAESFGVPGVSTAAASPVDLGAGSVPSPSSFWDALTQEDRLGITALSESTGQDRDTLAKEMLEHRAREDTFGELVAEGAGLANAWPGLGEMLNPTDKFKAGVMQSFPFTKKRVNDTLGLFGLKSPWRNQYRHPSGGKAPGTPGNPRSIKLKTWPAPIRRYN